MSETPEEGTRAANLWAWACGILAVVLGTAVYVVMNLQSILVAVGIAK